MYLSGGDEQMSDIEMIIFILLYPSWASLL
jgi:hypothetical protein